MRDQGALGVAGGSTGVDQHRRRIGACRQWCETRTCRLEQLAVLQAGSRRRCTHAEYAAQRRAALAHGQHVLDRTFIANRQHGLTILQPVLDRLRPEQHGQRHRHRTHLQHCHVGHSRLKALRHHDGHAPARKDAKPGQHLRQAVRLLLQLQVAEGFARSIGIGGINRHPAGGVGQGRPAATADLGDIELLRHPPLKAGVQARVVVRLAALQFVAVLTDVHPMPPYDAANVPSPTNFP